MRSNHLLFLFCLVVACKSTKQITQDQNPEILDTLTAPIEPDSIYLITQKGDTLSALDQEVEISIERFLPDTISVAAVGDIMVGTNFPNKSYLPKDSGAYLWDHTRTILQNADITFGNLEGTILDDGGEQKRV